MLNIRKRKVLRKPTTQCPLCDGHGYLMVDEDQNRTKKCNLCATKGYITREEFIKYCTGPKVNEQV